MIKRNQVLIHAITWMNLKTIQLNENTTQNESQLFHLCDILEKAKMKSDKRIPGPERNERALTTKGRDPKGFFAVMEILSLYLDLGGGYMTE